jgi:outer membrane protein TolC
MFTLRLSLSALLLALASVAPAMSLEEAETMALEADLRHQAWNRRAAAQGEEAEAADALADPRLTVAARNYPTDTFAHDQEAMTQNFVGLSQTFPAPGLRDARRQVVEARGKEFGARAGLATLETLRQVRLLWADLWYWRQAEQAAVFHEEHFRQSLESLTAAYRSGGASQQALFQLQSGLQRVSERRLHAAQRRAELRGELGRWLGAEVAPMDAMALPDGPDHLPRVAEDHPLLRIHDAEVLRFRREQALARRSARPDWGLELGYGFRAAEDLMGEQRPDMVSLGVSMELPVFAGGRDRRREKAAAMQTEAASDAREDQARQLAMKRRRTLAALEGIDRRLALMKDDWLPAARREAETTLQAYQSGTTPFSDVIDSRMRWLETRLQYDALRAERARDRVELRFLAATDLAEKES